MENIIIYKTIFNDYILTTERKLEECRAIRLNGRILYEFKDLIQKCLKIDSIHYDKLNSDFKYEFFHEIVDTVEKLEDIPEKYPEYLLC